MHITFFDDKVDPVTKHNWILEAIEHLHQRHTVDLICTRASGISSVVQAKFKETGIHHFDKTLFYAQDPNELAEISAFVGRKKSIVWLTSHYQDGTTPMKIWSTIALGENKRIRLAIKTATIREEFTRENYYPEEGRFVGGILAASKTTGADLIRAFDLPPEDIYVAYMGIGLDVFDFTRYGGRRDLCKKWGFDVRDTIIGVVGSIVPRKGQHLVLDAFSQVAKEFEHAKLAFVGKGNIERLKRQCEKRKLTGKVRFLGYHAHVAPIMKLLDILVLASSREGGIPRVITEAMAMKTAVISVDLGAISELVRDGVNGLLLPSQDANSIAERLRFLLSSQTELEGIKTRALESVQAFDRRLWIEKLEESMAEMWTRHV